jgi:hypothetical protein
VTTRKPRMDLSVAYVQAQDTLDLCRQVIAEMGDKLPVYTIVKLKQILAQENEEKTDEQEQMSSTPQ